MRGRSFVLGALALLALPGAARAADAPTRFSLANGCYAVSGVPGADHVRMQATALGRYLLYLPDHTFLAAQDDGSVAPASAPSPAADWRVEDAGGGTFTLTPVAGGRALAGVRFTAADGCG